MIITQQEFDELIRRPEWCLVLRGVNIKKNSPLLKQILPKWTANVESVYDQIYDWIGMHVDLLGIYLYKDVGSWRLVVEIRSEYPYYGLKPLSLLADDVADLEWGTDDIKVAVIGEIKRVTITLAADE